MRKRTSIRIPVELWAWLASRAKQEKRTISNLIVYLLEQKRDEVVDTSSNNSSDPQNEAS